MSNTVKSRSDSHDDRLPTKSADFRNLTAAPESRLLPPGISFPYDLAISGVESGYIDAPFPGDLNANPLNPSAQLLLPSSTLVTILAQNNAFLSRTKK